MSSSDPDKGTGTPTYENAGQLVNATDARGVVSHHVRDQLGRVTAIREGSASGALRTSWVYDTKAKGQLTSSTRHSGGAQYTTAVTAFDNAYRPLGQTVTIPSAEGALAGLVCPGFRGVRFLVLMVCPVRRTCGTRLPKAPGRVGVFPDVAGVPHRGTVDP